MNKQSLLLEAAENYAQLLLQDRNEIMNELKNTIRKLDRLHNGETSDDWESMLIAEEQKNAQLQKQIKELNQTNHKLQKENTRLQAIIDNFNKQNQQSLKSPITTMITNTIPRRPKQQSNPQSSPLKSNKSPKRIQFKKVLPQKFIMGNKSKQAHEKPAHHVEITNVFWITTTLISQKSMMEAIEECNFYSRNLGQTPAYEAGVIVKNAKAFRICTEAEWFLANLQKILVKEKEIEWTCDANINNLFYQRRKRLTKDPIHSKKANEFICKNTKYPYRRFIKDSHHKHYFRIVLSGDFTPSEILQLEKKLEKLHG